jgi:hypothetical protein
LNIWSNGGMWSGNMTTGGQAEFQIQWIEMTFNTSGPYNGTAKEKRSSDLENGVLEKRKNDGCETVCKIDGVQKIGTPEIVSLNDSSSGSDGGLSTGAKAGIAVGVIIGVLAVLAVVGVCLWRKKKAAGKGGFEMTKHVSNADRQTR